ncbi:PREDICTED: protocadherin alpha-6-like [Miniopterus natalensis]|uniref:protocadherin alpha-6-like n=1 Tax=Miniopterus natalensis TaxID=291302 RepID=UPI0007A6D894|nr:PREDICTED: protocadherin alpha-6-like [Miniopterus natalensis]
MSLSTMNCISLLFQHTSSNYCTAPPGLDDGGRRRFGLTDWIVQYFISMPTEDLLTEIKQQEFDMVITPEGRLGSRRLLLSLLLLAAWETGSGQVRYSVPEEAKHGAFVGRIAQDLGLELAELVLLSLVDGGQAPKASVSASAGAAGSEAALVDVNVYLIVAICAVSSLLVLTLLLYTAVRCSAAPSGGACGPGQPRLVCPGAGGSWSASQQRRPRVCSGEGAPKTDLMAFSPSLPPCPVVADIGERQDLKDDHCAKVSEFSSVTVNSYFDIF